MSTSMPHDSEKEAREVRLGVAGRLANSFLANGKISALTLFVLAAWGGLSFVLMPKQYNPEIVAPAFTITTEVPGASAEETRELVTRRIEDALSELPNIDEIASQSFPGGRSVVMVKFLVGSSQENTTIAVNQKLRDTSTSHPKDAPQPLVQSLSPDDVPILDIGLSSIVLSESSLRKLAIDVSDELKLTPGISKAEIKGGHINHLQVELDAQALSAKHISIGEISEAIHSANGSFSTNTTHAEDSHLVINVSSDIRGTEELGRIIIRRENDTVLRLQDIARISYGPGVITEFVRLSERNTPSIPVVHIALSRLPGENATTVSDEALNRLKNMTNGFIPEDVTVSILRDEGRTADEEISKLTLDLAKSILIVGLLLMLFLGLRNALVASLSIPLVLLCVFALGLLVGQTVNRITLFALILSLGLLVDDAIVVVENISRYFRLYPKENKLRLIVRAVDEVGGALTLSTVTMAIVFLPMAFVTGMMGPYMGPIPFFVPAALFASLLISVTLNPFLASLFLPSPRAIAQTKKQHFFTSLIAKVESLYAHVLSILLRDRSKRNLVLGLTAFSLLGAMILPLTPLVPFRMLPKADKEQFYLYVDLPDATTLDLTRSTVQALETSLFTEDGIVSVESFVGTAPVIDFNGLFKGSSGRVAPNQATLKVNLVHANERSQTSEAIALRAREMLVDFQARYPDALVRIVEDPPGPPVQSTFFLSIQGNNDALRENIARDLATEISMIDGVVDLDTSLPKRGADITYRVRSDKAQALGIAPRMITETLSAALSGSTLGVYHRSEHPNLRKAEQEFIVVRFAQEHRDALSDLSHIMLPTWSGESISLTEVIEREDDSPAPRILAENRVKSTSISAEMSGRSVVYAVLDLFPKLLNYTLPSGNGEVKAWSPLRVTYEDRDTHEQFVVEIKGEWALTLEVFRDLGMAMAAGIFLVFFILAAHTQSMIIPMLIMVSIPLGLIGILPGFAVLHTLKGTYFNATSMIGVIALSGLSVKNAVIYLEYLEPLKRAGKPLQEALIETGRVRLLPIVLTSLAAIFGSLTIVSDPVWEGLAWAIIFGLLASTLLTLIIFPVLYFLFEHRHWKK